MLHNLRFILFYLLAFIFICSVLSIFCQLCLDKYNIFIFITRFYDCRLFLNIFIFAFNMYFFITILLIVFISHFISFIIVLTHILLLSVYCSPSPFLLCFPFVFN